MTLYQWTRNLMGGDDTATVTMLNAWMRTDWYATVSGVGYAALVTGLVGGR